MHQYPLKEACAFAITWTPKLKKVIYFFHNETKKREKGNCCVIIVYFIIRLGIYGQKVGVHWSDHHYHDSWSHHCQDFMRTKLPTISRKICHAKISCLCFSVGLVINFIPKAVNKSSRTELGLFWTRFIIERVESSLILA